MAFNHRDLNLMVGTTGLQNLWVYSSEDSTIDIFTPGYISSTDVFKIGIKVNDGFLVISTGNDRSVWGKVTYNDVTNIYSIVRISQIYI